MEVSYDIDEKIAAKSGKVNRWWRPWYARGGYFGLYITPQLVLDIFATFLPHVPWARVADPKGCTRIEPMRPETWLPKGWKVDPADCPRHEFDKSPFSRDQHPSDQCPFCGQRRDPDWVSPYTKRAA